MSKIEVTPHPETAGHEFKQHLNDVLDRTRDLPGALQPLREEILASLVMFAQIPAPTGEEQQRVRHMLDRFVEAGLTEAGPDEMGNAVGFLPGARGKRTIMLVSHLDTIIPKDVDHNVVVQADQLIGPGISDNALGAAVVSMIPTCLKELGIQLNNNLHLLGSVHSLERGNHGGLRFHLDHLPRTIDYGICIEGVQLGRLNFFSIGTLRGDITCDVRRVESRSYGAESAIVVLNQIINRLLSIETPSRPYTKIQITKIRAGKSYDVEPDHAELGFEVNSHSDSIIERIGRQIEDIVTEMSARHAVDARLDCFFQREAGGIPFSHPLVKTTLKVMSSLEIEPDQGHSPSELSEFISRDIPAVTLGVTFGEKNRKKPDHVMIEPMLRGVSQIIGVLLAIDQGVCDES
ncbi:MAG: peptidase [Planctomycetes bacterium]|nr:peptidase [Planctomycetota bacterium]